MKTGCVGAGLRSGGHGGPPSRPLEPGASLFEAMPTPAPALLYALEAITVAHGAVERVQGQLDDHGNHALKETANELGFLVRRIRNICLLNGVEPGAVEMVKLGRLK